MKNRDDELLRLIFGPLKNERKRPRRDDALEKIVDQDVFGLRGDDLFDQIFGESDDIRNKR